MIIRIASALDLHTCAIAESDQLSGPDRGIPALNDDIAITKTRVGRHDS